MNSGSYTLVHKLCVFFKKEEGNGYFTNSLLRRVSVSLLALTTCIRWKINQEKYPRTRFYTTHLCSTTMLTETCPLFSTRFSSVAICHGCGLILGCIINTWTAPAPHSQLYQSRNWLFPLITVAPMDRACCVSKMSLSLKIFFLIFVKWRIKLQSQPYRLTESLFSYNKY